MMRCEHKSWGLKTTLFRNDLCEVSVLELREGERCSWHRHRAKWNQFYVIRGRMEVLTQEGRQVVDRGQIFTTNPGQWHEFQTPYGPVTVQEIMYVRYDPEDIERQTAGGKIIGNGLTLALGK